MRDFPDFIHSFIAKLSTCKLYNLYEIQHFVMKISLTVFERVAWTEHASNFDKITVAGIPCISTELRFSFIKRA